MNLIIFHDKIDVKLFIKKEKKEWWIVDNNIYLIAHSKKDITSLMTEIIIKNKVTKIFYLGIGFSIKKDIKIEDIVIINKSLNTTVDLTKFGYKIGMFPKEEDNKFVDLNIIENITKKCDYLKIANSGSSNIENNNRHYHSYIEEKFKNKFEVLDKLTAVIFFVAKKFNINYIINILLIDSNRYDHIQISDKDLKKVYKDISKII